MGLYGIPKKINGKYRTFCRDCGQETYEVIVGLINFGDKKHFMECPDTWLKSCPHCKKDLDY